MELLKLNDNLSDICSKLSRVMLEGGIAIVPFDTIYGFICNPRDEKALKKIFDIKNRDGGLTIGVACDSLDSMLRITQPNDSAISYLSDKVPGQFTFIVPVKDGSISPLCTKNGTIGIRIPNCPLVQEVARSCGGAVAQTSANISKKPFCLSIKEIKKQFGPSLIDVDLIIDGGILSNGMPSKLIDLTETEPKEIART